jgi:acetolactate synthase-1/2/3 large subunit
MKCSDYIARFLESKQINCVFELIGGTITFLVDSISKLPSVRLVSMHHEQGAGFAAEGFSRATSKPGVALATSGPGATNLVTAIGSCYFDSSPCIFITGQVNRHEMKLKRKIRQLGFQETDIVSIVKPITKFATTVLDPEALPEILHRAYSLSLQGRPGPVLIDIPFDIQRSTIRHSSERSSPTIKEPLNTDHLRSFCDLLQTELNAAVRPLVLIGGGVNSPGVRPRMIRFIEKLNIPCVLSLMAVDTLPVSHPLRVGFIGSYGNRWANTALADADVLLVLGSRLDIRQTGADTNEFRRNRTIFHVDCERGELNNRVKRCQTICSDLSSFLDFAEMSLTASTCPLPWSDSIHQNRLKWPDTSELSGLKGINPNIFIMNLSDRSPAASAFVVDVGQHQMWSAQSIRLRPNQRFFTSGGMGAMGFALPAGIGACLGLNRAPVVVIAGDGGLQLNIQELQTISRNRLPIKIVVINNNAHGMVRQFQESYFEKRYQSTVNGYSAPDFCKVAAAYDIPSARIDSPDSADNALTKMWQDPNEPFLLEVIVPQEANAYPKLAFGKTLREMEPLDEPLDMETT